MNATLIAGNRPWDDAFVAAHLHRRGILGQRGVVGVERKTSLRRAFLVTLSDGSALFVKHCPRSEDSWELDFFDYRRDAPAVVAELSPPLIDFDDQLRISVTEGLTGYTVAAEKLAREERIAEGDLRAIARALAALHDTTAAGDRTPAALRGDPPFHTISDLSPRQFADGPGVDYPRFVAEMQAATAEFRALRSRWRPRCVIHGDLKADNVLLRDGDVRFVDWELSRRGDPLWDAATLVGHHLFTWLRSIQPSQSATLEQWIHRSRIPIDWIAESITTFWSEYTRRLRLPLDDDAVETLFRYAAVFLFTRAYADLALHGSMRTHSILSLEFGRSILRNPGAGAALFTLPAVCGGGA